jgi:undecaprenyl diphosphate synthase
MNPTCSQWQLEPSQLPRHVGIIMDGNGRWATSRRLPRIAGHRKGVERVQEITELAGNLGLEALTLYAFSDENWRRPEEEVGALMGLLRVYLRAERARIIKNNVRFRVIGDRRKLSSDILGLIEELEADTRPNTGMHLCIALSYGGRGEILRAVKRIVQSAQDGSFFVDDLDEAAFSDALDTAGLPCLDMMVRTSGEQRISNFLLWQAAYAELFFDHTLWPDFDSARFVQQLKGFAARDRRFGMTPEQVGQIQKETAGHLPAVEAASGLVRVRKSLFALR